jgi:hypothetical protein
MKCLVYQSRFRDLEFVEEQDEWPHRWEKDTVYYEIIHHPDLKLISERELNRACNLAMTTWDIEIPVTFKNARDNHVEPDIFIRFSSPAEDTLFRDRPSVLAYAYFPATSLEGQIVFNLSYLWDTKGLGIKGSEAVKKGVVKEVSNPDSTLRTYNIIHVLIHELGHSLGLRHDASGNRDGVDVMDAYYRGDALDLSERDIYRIRLKYGVRQFVKWTHYDRLKRLLKKRVRRG